jgi:hypothetical protein
MRWTIFAVLGLFPAGLAFAQSPEPDPNPEPIEGEDSRDEDIKPEAPTPDLPNPAEDTIAYAGVGSSTAYSERGVGEFGGSASFALSNDVTTFSADPMVGYFLWDNLQLSGILGVRHLSVDGQNSNRFSVMAEPSVHIPVSNDDSVFWVGGLGAGVALGNDVDDDPGLESGLALAPRTGVQILLGRSGLLNLGARYSAVFTNVDTRVGPLEGQAVLAFANTFDIQAGYTVMF